MKLTEPHSEQQIEWRELNVDELLESIPIVWRTVDALRKAQKVSQETLEKRIDV